MGIPYFRSMKTLFILRHGKAERPHAGLRDVQRKLTDRGRSDAERAAATLQGQLAPDAPGAVSAAARTVETAAAVQAVTGWQVPEALPDGYLAPALFWLQAVNAWSDDHAAGLVIGHNPGLSACMEYLTGQPVALPTAGLATLRFQADRWAEVGGGCGELVSVWTPSVTFGA